MNFLPQVESARYRGAYRIHLEFNDGSQATLDFRGWLKGTVFEPLKDLDQFRRFFLEGGTVTWANGADIAPETLYARARKSRSRQRPLPKRARRRNGVRAKGRPNRTI